MKSGGLFRASPGTLASTSPQTQGGYFWRSVFCCVARIGDKSGVLLDSLYFGQNVLVRYVVYGRLAVWWLVAGCLYQPPVTNH